MYTSRGSTAVLSMLRGAAVVLALLLACSLPGCASRQYQRFYFAAANLDANPPTLKFYRTTISARNRFTKANFATGYYDANALRSLYGEAPDPAAAGSPAASDGAGTVGLAFNAASGAWQAIGKDTLFTIFYGSDATAIAGQVQAFADADATGQLMGRLLAAAVLGDDVAELEDAQADAEESTMRNAVLATLLNDLAQRIESESTTAEVALAEAGAATARALSQSLGLSPELLPPDADAAALRVVYQRLTDALLNARS